ncbi:MAG: hypothetical protein EXR77_07015 [Myxococcales bacterium]|nr:hypothetical protein [Myxococcales bacterium]
MATADELRAQAKQAARSGQFARAGQLAAGAADAYFRSKSFDNAHVCRVLQARCSQQAGDLNTAEDLLRAAISDAQRRGHQRQTLEGMTELGAVLELVGNLREAVALHREVMALRSIEADPVGYAIASANVARLVTRLAPPERRSEALIESRKLLTESGQLFVAHGHAAHAGHVLVVLGDLERGSGHLTEAKTALLDALKVAERTGQASLLSITLLNLAMIERDLGQSVDCRAHLKRAHAVATKAGDRLQLARILLAQALLAADDLPPFDVAALFASVEADFVAIGQHQGAIPAIANRASAMARAGHLHEAHSLLAKLQVQLQSAGDRLSASEIDLSLAELLFSIGDKNRFTLAMQQLQSADLPIRLEQRLLLLRARESMRSLDLANVREFSARVRGAEISRSASFSLELLRAQLLTFAGDFSATDVLKSLAQQAAPSPRESAAVSSALATTLAWQGQVNRATDVAHEALAKWQALQEPLSIASAACTVICTSFNAAEREAAWVAIDRQIVMACRDQALVCEAVRLLLDRNIPAYQRVLVQMRKDGNESGAVWLARVSGGRLANQKLLDFAQTIAVRHQIR